MTAFPDTQAVGLEGSRRATARETFMSQTPLALVAILAIAAIVAVNAPETPQSSAATPVSQATAASIACPDCGEVVAIKPIPAAEAGAAGPVAFAVEVRMSDGSLRVVRQSASRFGVGDRVRVNGDALTTGS